MWKIKIFNGDEMYDLEQKVNNFIKEKYIDKFDIKLSISDYTTVIVLKYFEPIYEYYIDLTKEGQTYVSSVCH